MKKLFQNKYFKVFLVGAALILFIQLVYNFEKVLLFINQIFSIVSPFIFAAVLTYFLYPLTKKVNALLRRSKINWIINKSRGLAIAITYVFTILVFGVILLIVIPSVWESINSLIMNLEKYINNARDILQQVSTKNSWLRESKAFTEIIESIRIETVAKFINLENLSVFFKSLMSISNTILNIILGVVISIYIMLELNNLKKTIKKILSLIFKEKSKNVFIRYVHKSNEIFWGFLSAKFIDSIFITIICIIAFWIMDVPYYLLLAIIVGIFNMIPYFGPVIGAIPVIFISFIAGSLQIVIMATIFIFILMQIDGIIISPRIMTKTIGVSPFWTMIALIIGGGLFGFWGLLLGVPVMAVVKIIFNDYLDDRKLNNSESSFN